MVSCGVLALTGFAVTIGEAHIQRRQAGARQRPDIDLCPVYGKIADDCIPRVGLVKPQLAAGLCAGGAAIGNLQLLVHQA